MEALGQGLASIGNALGIIGGWIGFVCVIGIAASTFLIYTEKITLEQLKDFEQLKDLFNKERRYR